MVTMNGQKILNGAVAGILSAVIVDLHAWQNDGFAFSWAKSFEWRVAIIRWLQGAVTGALAGAGLGVVI